MSNECMQVYMDRLQLTACLRLHALCKAPAVRPHYCNSAGHSRVARGLRSNVRAIPYDMSLLTS